MNEKLIVLISEIILASATIGALAIILLSSWYDLRIASMKKRLQRASLDLARLHQPFVTLVVYTHNQASTVTESLDAIAKSHYAKYQLVVANHGSTDKTGQLVKQYQKSHPKFPVKLYTAKPIVNYDDVIQRAVKKSPGTNLVMILDGSSFITPNALAESVAHFSVNDRLTRLQLREQIDVDISIQTLTSHFFSLSKNLFYKALSVLHLIPRHTSRVVMYRQSPLPKNKTLYASNVAFTSAKSSNSPLRPLRQIIPILLLCILVISLVSYWMWTAAALKSNALLTLSWVAVSIWLLAVIWSDNIIKVTRKIELSLSVPFMYFLIYVRSIKGFFVSFWQLIRSTPYRRLVNAYIAESYSSRY